MIIILTIIYSAGCFALGFFLMNKYDRFLNMLEEKTVILITRDRKNDSDKRYNG